MLLEKKLLEKKFQYDHIYKVKRLTQIHGFCFAKLGKNDHFHQLKIINIFPYASRKQYLILKYKNTIRFCK